MSDGNAQETARSPGRSTIGLLLGAILGVILSIAFGLIAVGLIWKPGSAEKPGPGAPGEEQRWEKRDFVIAPEKDEIKFNVANTALTRRGMARCWIWYRTTDPEATLKLLESDKRRIDSLKMALKGHFSGKELGSFEGPEAMEALSEEGRRFAQRILFPEEPGVPKVEVTDFFLDVMIQ